MITIAPPMKAIPTVYKGVKFRSRLEARWAAFFDLAGWVWDYEPIDLDGWAPDFAITTPDATVYVEVKPVELVRNDPFGLQLPPSASFDKAKRHWLNVWVLSVGIGPQDESDYFGIGCLCDPPQSATRDGIWFAVNDQLGVSNARALWRQAGTIVQWVPA